MNCESYVGPEYTYDSNILDPDKLLNNRSHLLYKFINGTMSDSEQLSYSKTTLIPAFNNSNIECIKDITQLLSLVRQRASRFADSINMIKTSSLPISQALKEYNWYDTNTSSSNIDSWLDSRTPEELSFLSRKYCDSCKLQSSLIPSNLISFCKKQPKLECDTPQISNIKKKMNNKIPSPYSSDILFKTSSAIATLSKENKSADIQANKYNNDVPMKTIEAFQNKFSCWWFY